MEERKELVKSLAALWKKHKEREILYLTAMKIENLGKLRKICSQGYSMSLLFQREIRTIYDTLRCSFDDIDLCKHCTKHLKSTIANLNTAYAATSVLAERESETLKCYSLSLSFLDESSEEGRVMLEHIALLTDVNSVLQGINKRVENIKESSLFIAAA
jgi:hypothetical protein